MIQAALWMCVGAAVIAVAALVRRRSLADRLLALEVAVVATAASVALAPSTGFSSLFVDVVLVLGLVGFTSTLAAARYLEHRAGAS